MERIHPACDPGSRVLKIMSAASGNFRDERLERMTGRHPVRVVVCFVLCVVAPPGLLAEDTHSVRFQDRSAIHRDLARDCGTRADVADERYLLRAARERVSTEPVRLGQSMAFEFSPSPEPERAGPRDIDPCWLPALGGRAVGNVEVLDGSAGDTVFLINSAVARMSQCQEL